MLSVGELEGADEGAVVVLRESFDISGSNANIEEMS